MPATTPLRTILVGEDDREVRNYIESALRCHQYEVVSAADGEQVMSCLQRGTAISAVLLDLMMPRKDGVETLREIRQIRPDLPVIMLSAMTSPAHIVNAIKIGATDFVSKPVSHEEIAAAISKALSLSPTTEGPRPAGNFDGVNDMFFGNSVEMSNLRTTVTTFAASDFPILIRGETGTGKEVLARRVHALSTRSRKPFVKVNCAALPSDLMESEVFGYERGAFTGAFQRKPGIFEIAQGGTVFLDEIGDMDAKLQAKLLQVLQDHEFRRLGGKETIRVDVRVLAATHRNLEEGIRNNAFREDLYYRLNTITLTLPALRDRKEDIVSLAEFLISKYPTGSRAAFQLTPALKQEMETYQWPGNIRELENVVRRLLVLGDPEAVICDLRGRAQREESRSVDAHVRPSGQNRRVPVTPKPSSILAQVSQAKEQAEAEAIISVLNATRWNRKQAATLLNIDYKALLYKIKKLSIEQRVMMAVS